MSREIVIGIDGGGTYTRAMAADLHGNVLSYMESGGSNPKHNSNAADHVREAINAVVGNAGCMLSDAVFLVAGFAGLDTIEDREWADKFTALPGLMCAKELVNDALIAHTGALGSKPGIIVISGTGSVVYGVTEHKRHLCNYDFRHYAASAARFLSYDTVFRIIAGEYEKADQPFIEEILTFWGVQSIRDLALIGSSGFISIEEQCNRRFGEMAPLVTKAAEKGIGLACKVCDSAVSQLMTGVSLVGACFSTSPIPVVFTGGVFRSAYMKQGIMGVLSADSRFQAVSPVFSSVAGAVLLGLEKLGVDTGQQVVCNLMKHSESGYCEK